MADPDHAFPSLPHAGGGDVRPGGVAAPQLPARVGAPAEVAGAAVRRSGTETVLDALAAVRSEMADRDEELRDVLTHLGRLWKRISSPAAIGFGERVDGPAAGAAATDDAVRAMLHSVDTLATVTEASVDRAGDLSRSIQRLVESVQGLSSRLDRLVSRAESSDMRLDKLEHAVDGVVEQVAMIGRRLSAPIGAPRPRLRAVAAEPAPGGAPSAG